MLNWITERDKKVYDYLQNNTRYVSSSQLTELFFKTDEHGRPINQGKLICCRRMKLLEKNLNVKSFYRQSKSDKIYSCLPIRIEQIITLNQIEHSLALNDIYINLKRYADTHHHVIHTFRTEIKLSGIIPDILLVYIINNRARAFLVEYDTGTEHLPVIKRKVEKYKSYFGKQSYLQEDWQPGSLKPELFFLCKSEKRAEAINKIGQKAILAVETILNW